MNSDLHAWIFFLTNPISIVVYYAIFEMIFEMIRKLTSLRGYVIWDVSLAKRLLVFAVIILISFAVHFRLIFTNDSQPSKVDASPLANLTCEQISKIEDIVAQLHDSEHIRNFRVTPSGNNYSYGFVFDRISEQRGSVFVSIRIHENKQQAADRIASMRRRTHYTTLVNYNGTEAMLFNSFRSGNAFHTGPITWRILRTVILIGNATINLNENVEHDELHLNVATDFIAFLYEQMTQQ